MSTPEATPLYAAREPIFPRRVSGKFRNLKWVLMALMLGVYYLLPLIRWDRGRRCRIRRCWWIWRTGDSSFS